MKRDKDFTKFYVKILVMMNPSNISSNIARQILVEAKKNGVSVEDYLNKIAKKKPNYKNGDLPKVRRTKTVVDLSKERKWLEENRDNYIGKWVVLDGEKLVGAGDDPKPLVDEARANGVKIPFVHFIEDDSIPFTGGWL